MCGIIGIASNKSVSSNIVNALKKDGHLVYNQDDNILRKKLNNINNTISFSSKSIEKSNINLKYLISIFFLFISLNGQ